MMASNVKNPSSVNTAKSRYKQTSKGKEGVLQVNRRYRDRKRQERELTRPVERLTYLMRMGSTPFFKIGIAFNPTQRRAEVQVGNPLPVTIVTTCPFNVEGVLHKKYRDRACIGEWFRFEADELIEVLTDFQLANLLTT